MEHRYFIYTSIICLLYSYYLKNELKYNWKEVKSIVKHAKVNEPIMQLINGINVTEMESNADVIYKINNEIKTGNVNVTRSQPVQVGNVIKIKYNENDRKRLEKKIPSHQEFFTFGIFLLIIGTIIYLKNKD